jgi:hypothetical protein
MRRRRSPYSAGVYGLGLWSGRVLPEEAVTTTLFNMPTEGWLIIFAFVVALGLVLFLIPRPLRRSRHRRKH